MVCLSVNSVSQTVQIEHFEVPFQHSLDGLRKRPGIPVSCVRLESAVPEIETRDDTNTPQISVAWTTLLYWVTHSIEAMFTKTVQKRTTCMEIRICCAKVNMVQLVRRSVTSRYVLHIILFPMWITGRSSAFT
jgi:hypothetical protein